MALDVHHRSALSIDRSSNTWYCKKAGGVYTAWYLPHPFASVDWTTPLTRLTVLRAGGVANRLLDPTPKSPATVVRACTVSVAGCGPNPLEDGRTMPMLFLALRLDKAASATSEERPKCGASAPVLSCVRKETVNGIGHRSRYTTAMLPKILR
jgi:hypothetical protein